MLFSATLIRFRQNLVALEAVVISTTIIVVAVVEGADVTAVASIVHVLVVVHPRTRRRELGTTWPVVSIYLPLPLAAAVNRQQALLYPFVVSTARKARRGVVVVVSMMKLRCWRLFVKVLVLRDQIIEVKVGIHYWTRQARVWQAKAGDDGQKAPTAKFPVQPS
jgi:hypothetical protein